jgi:hypothetical protein
MAAFTKRKNKDGSTTHRAVIVRKGYPRMSHTGTSRHAVELWAASEESKIIGGTAPKIIRDQRTVSALFDEYAVKITAKKRGNTSPEISRLGQYKQLKWASKLVHDVRHIQQGGHVALDCRVALQGRSRGRAEER